MRIANIIKFVSKEKYVIYPISNTVNSGGIAVEPYIFLEGNIGYTELAKEILKVLEYSELDIDSPKDWKDYRKEYLKSMKVKTMKELHMNSFSLGILIKDNILKLTPTKNGGSRQGFQYLKSLEAVELPADSSIEKIADALKEALSRCI